MGTWPKALTEEEKQYLRDNAQLLTINDMAEKIGRAPVTVRRFLQKEGLLEKRTRSKKDEPAIESQDDLMTAVDNCYRWLEPFGAEEQKRALLALKVMLGHADIRVQTSGA